MKTMMLIPTLAVALVTASASLTAALACNPPAGQCCTGDWFHENGRGLPQSGGIWNGRTCLNPADACKARGWNWDGKSCKPPVPNLVPRTMIPR